jgi:NAD(P)-dependent dehydrogenase (short-subunit alcohol dehydrogenase family)
MNVLDMFSLKGKVAVVTGGAEKIGRQCALALAQAGAKTYVSSRSEARLAEIEESYRREGVEVRALQLDLGNEYSIKEFYERIVSENDGQVDVLVNNAGARLMTDWDDVDHFVKALNIYGAGMFRVTRLFGQVMMRRRSGSIINIGSIHGMVGTDASLYEGLETGVYAPYAPDYYFIKGGIVNFTRIAASYYGPYNVRCNCVSPGGLRSDRNSQEFARRYAQRTFLGRMAGPDDFMGTIVYLASDASRYVTGVNIPVDGGYTAK